ncbi:hypothetical protein BBK82_19680 [Lentzea guizhouensis]|uniref:ATP-grasp domain-containing protein n=1 Tax=Lentzea guizhouensis TaxID=1586287 RepID=A0A1B2HJN3_9PSEU|nr:hypothetical protein [Lentzea guizhouensis]ANZ37946.1 hypothetical protein BBK82_19680 [Lentzea guizhouensis]
MPPRPKVLYVTDLAYPARGRRYCDEDIYLTSRLREHFDIALCNPRDAAALLGNGFDVTVVRNSGPVIDYPEAYREFRERAKDLNVYNPLTGKADMAGKQYLVDLTEQGSPVIPTVDRREDVAKLPAADLYVVKPKAGADSHGLEFVPREKITDKNNTLIQPKIDFEYEVSFYYVDDEFQYALYAPETDRRWELRAYEATSADLEFAEEFIRWNGLAHGIQRVDACRTREGGLLLVELEDLNPYLSLDRTSEETRERFVRAMARSIKSSAG